MVKPFAYACLLLALLPTGNALAALQAFVDRNPVSLNESFTLTLENDGERAEPDLEPLKKDFDILGQSQSSSVQIVNGRTSSKRSWQIGLMAKRAGQLQLPSIRLGDEQSLPIALNVLAAGTAGTDQTGDDALYIEVSVEPQRAYVQQQLIYTIKLLHRVELGQGSRLSEPAFDASQVLVERLGEDRSYQTTLAGRRYGVIERRYALYPQQSGELAIQPVRFEGRILEGRAGSGLFAFDPFNQRSRVRRTDSAALSVSVQPVPAAFRGKQWLPAADLQLVQQWSGDPPGWRVGEPVTRTLALIADGLSAAQLPVISAAQIEGFRQYPDQPVLKNNQDTNGISATRQEKLALMPTRAGTLRLPAIAIPWWNTRTDQPEVAHLPETLIEVAPAPLTSTPPADPPPPVVSQPALPLPAAADTATPTAPEPVATPRDGWPWLALALGCGWLLTLLLWWWQHRRRPADAADARSGPRPGASAAALRRRVKAACEAGDAAATRTALLDWAAQHWSADPPLALPALALRLDGELAEALDRLDRHLYAGQQADWQPMILWRLLEQYPPEPQTRNNRHTVGLADMLPEG